MAAAKRIANAALCALACGIAGCREIPAVDDGVRSVSAVQLPSPALVAGDTMRDSTGDAAPLRVTAYGLDGEPLSPQPPSAFIVIDTGAHLAGSLLVGDSVGRTVRVVGTVGSLQTQIASVPVTALPDTLVAADSLLFHKSYSLITGDTVVTSAELGVKVQNIATAAGVLGVIVHYTVDRAPVANGSEPTVVVMNGAAKSSRDTTDASGRASRTARLRLLALSAPGTDTVEVSATSSYRGTVIGTVQFLVIFTKQ